MTRRTPAPVLLTTAAVHSDEWFAAREGAIGGSEIAAVLGLGRWTSTYALWHLKKGLVPPDAGNDRTSRGHDLEPALLARLARNHPELHWRNTPNRIYAHAKRPYILASADALGYPTRRARRAKAIGEAKTDADGWKWGTEGTDEVPVDYRCQVIQTMDVHGADVAYVVVLDGSLRIREFEVPAEPDTAAYMAEEARKFLVSLEGQAPPIDASTHTYEVLRQLHPEIEDRDHEVSTDLACEYAAATLALRKVEKRAGLAKNLLANEMGLARRAVVGEGKTAKSIATRQDKSRGAEGGRPSVVAGRTETLEKVLRDLAYPLDDDDTEQAIDDLDVAEIAAALRGLPRIPTGATS